MRLIFLSLPLLQAVKEDITINADSNKNKGFTERVIDMVKRVLRLHHSPWQTFLFYTKPYIKKKRGESVPVTRPTHRGSRIAQSV